MDLRTVITSFEIQLFSTFLLICLAGVTAFFSILSIKSEVFPRHRKIILLVVTLILWTLASKVGIRMIYALQAVPRMNSSKPKNAAIVDRKTSEITIVFQTPVLFPTLSIYTHPQQDVSLIPQKYLWGLLPFGTKLTIVPKTTLPPNSQFMVYVSNVEGPFTKGFGGEHLLEYTTQDVIITDTGIADSAPNVSPGARLTYTISGTHADENEWRIQLDPPTTEISLKKVNDQTLEAIPRDPLRQGTQYTVRLHFTPVIYQITDGVVVKRLGEQSKSTYRFTTAKPALIDSFEPQGTNIDPKQEIRIVFDEEMDEKSLHNFVSLSPPVNIHLSLSTDKKTLRISHPEFNKDTQITVSLEKGLTTKNGGTLENDITYNFHTAGPLQVSNMNPSDGATTIGVRSPIRITFDQDIPAPAADHFHIIPELTGKKTVSNNILEFVPDQPLSSETRYTIKLDAGMPSVYGLPLVSEQSYSFTTSQNTVSLNVPFMRQQSLFTCNVSAARMLLSYRGISVTEADLIDKIGIGGKRGSGNPYKGYIDDYGTYWDAVSRGVGAYRPNRLITSGSLSDIINELKKGNPVMTWGQNGWSDPHDISWTAYDGSFIKAVNGMHSSVVRGYTGPENNPSQILINDPWRGQYSISTAEFMRRWEYFKIAMVID